MRDDELKQADDYVFYDLPETHLKVGESTIVASDPVSPTGKVTPVGLTIAPDVAPHVAVTDIKVGKNSQLVSTGCLPATLFALDPPVDLRMEDVPPGRMILVNVTNVGREDVVLRSRIRGVAPQSRLDKGRTHVVGLGYTAMRGGSTEDIVVRPLVDLKLTRLHVPLHLLDVFQVEALYQGRYLDVEKISGVTDASQLSAESLARGGAIDVTPYPVVGCSQPVTVRVTNTSRETSAFMGALIGICRS